MLVIEAVQLKHYGEISALVDKPVIRYQKVSKSFGDLKVLREIDLDIAAGEIVAVIGSSGSGKTTLARMLMTLEQPTSGVIIVDGEPLWHKEVNGELVPADEKHIRRVRSKIGMVFQQFNLFPHMTILRNITEAPVHVLGIPRAEAEKRAVDMLNKVGLGDKLNVYPSQLSGGQQQRVAIARALVMRPKVMLFDEVTSALDPELVGEVLEVLKEIAAEGETTMLLITHEMDFARDVADRIIFIDKGRIVEQGPPKVILGNPRNPRTREFLSRFRQQWGSRN
ncbi:ectoine/hydroxyectoine ABC transporter ATP-binding protein EhuA [Desulfallas thermosapovorans]|uniref:Amino acid ABC transporter ATP-binding protein, PAAT family (TC 3.A.1.3.-) n=1 Tax=Desulfallas thermosapovorans DSM 6562 TaxID=1121431 RepID=A0A5S4ZPB1_9FIRM|nr:ectoine/hydroxyectoine ABC transporter ATP-binding protein EhuA [Desulfallas thermosapovorans]TYO93910.1 amino acid ABC transporter ATP-binding protein, PAAT family (TC 3.A.1.3.-) [Desulfallas thermosapovorans DSM 6562]